MSLVLAKLRLNNENARNLAHAPLKECSFSSTSATLSGRRLKFFLAHALNMGKIQFFRLFSKFSILFVTHALVSEKIDMIAWVLI